MPEAFIPITEPDDPRLANTPLNEPEGLFNDILAEPAAGVTTNVKGRVYGPVVGEYHHDAMFGPDGNKLTPDGVALSPDLLEVYPLGSRIRSSGKDYTVQDVSYVKPNHPNTNTIEFRDQKNPPDRVDISPSPIPSPQGGGTGLFDDVIAAPEPAGGGMFGDIIGGEEDHPAAVPATRAPVDISGVPRVPSPTPSGVPSPTGGGDPDIPAKIVRALGKYARGMIPTTGAELAKAAGIPLDFSQPDELARLMVPPPMRVNLDMIQQTKARYDEIVNADETPAFSQERFDAGIGTALDLLGIAGIGTGIKFAMRGRRIGPAVRPEPVVPPPAGTAGAAPPPVPNAPVPPTVEAAKPAPVRILTPAEREGIQYGGDKSTGLTQDDLQAIDEIDQKTPPPVPTPAPVAPAVEKPKIVGAAIKDDKTGKLYTGPAHPLIYDKFPEIKGDPNDAFTGEGWNTGGNYTDGFVDQNGKFYDREEAAALTGLKNEASMTELESVAGKIPEAPYKIIEKPKAERKPVEPSVTQRVRPLTMLRRHLAQVERAGAAGFKRGTKEGRAAAEAQAKIEAKQIRDTIATADRWLEADIQDVRKILLSFSRHLSLHERGKFIPAITKAMRRPPIFSRDPQVIRRRAASLMDRMTAAIYNEQKKNVQQRIEKLLQKIQDSPSVVLSQKRVVQQIGKMFDNLKDKMSLDMLDRMYDNLKWQEAHGRDLFNLNKTVEEQRQQLALNDMESQGARVANKPEQTLIPIGDVETWWQRKANLLAKVPQAWRTFNYAITPMDWVFQIFDQKPMGKLWEHMKAPIDIQYGQFLDTAHVYKQRLLDVMNKYKLNDGNFKRIYAHAEYRQKGGEENLKAIGYTDKDIATIKNVGQLTKGERAYLREADAINHEMFPAIKQVLEDFYNQDISSPEGYFPRIRDWDYYNSLSIEQGKFADAYRRTNVRDGFTKERTNGLTKNLSNAHDVMMKHIDDAVYHMTMGPAIKRNARIVADPRFKAMVGDFGQNIFADWVDVLARNGGAGFERRIGWMDWLRKNTGVGQLAFRLTTTFLQPLQLIQALPYLGKNNLARTLSEFGDPANRAWILKNFPEVKHRVTDDPAAMGYTTKSIRDKAANIGFHYMAKWDRYAAMTVAETAYRDALEKRGLTFNRNNALHMQAYAEAMNVVRRTQASPYTKDVPLAISGGKLAGNKSINQAIFQFQNFTMNRWAMMKHDGMQMGIKDKSAARGAHVMTYVIAATMIEQLLREGIANALRATVGMSEHQAAQQAEEEKKSLAQRITERSVADLASTMPLISNISGMYRYDSSGVPIADTLHDVAAGLRSVIRGKQTSTKMAGGVRMAQAAGTAVGAPVGQIGELLTRLIQGQANATPYQGPVAPPPPPPAPPPPPPPPY